MTVCCGAISAIVLLAFLGAAIFPLYIAIRNKVRRMIWATSLNKLSLQQLTDEMDVLKEQKREGESAVLLGATSKNYSADGILGGFKVSDADARMKLIERQISELKSELNQ